MLDCWTIRGRLRIGTRIQRPVTFSWGHFSDGSDLTHKATITDIRKKKSRPEGLIAGLLFVFSSLLLVSNLGTKISCHMFRSFRGIFWWIHGENSWSLQTRYGAGVLLPDTSSNKMVWSCIYLIGKRFLFLRKKKQKQFAVTSGALLLDSMNALMVSLTCPKTIRSMVTCRNNGGGTSSVCQWFWTAFCHTLSLGKCSWILQKVLATAWFCLHLIMFA